MDWASIFFFLFLLSVFTVMYNRFLLHEKKKQLDIAIRLFAEVLSQDKNKDEKEKYEFIALNKDRWSISTDFGRTPSKLDDQLYVIKRVIRLINE